MRDRFTSVRKADLHVHFEGTVTPSLLIGLAKRNQIPLERPIPIPGRAQPLPAPVGNFSNDSEQSQLFPVHDFPSFISLYLKTTECIRTTSDVVEIGFAYIQSALSQNIVYSELYFTPASFSLFHRDLTPLFDGLIEVQQQAAQRGTCIRWIFDIVRNRDIAPGAVPGDNTLTAALNARKAGVDVVAIGLGGYEHPADMAPFREIFHAARGEGFATYAHAGELAGAENIRATVDHLQPSRIGHGIHVMEDPTLADELRKRGTVFEVCPWSNILLGAHIESTHPVAQMVSAGLEVVIASDDPGIFGKDLVDNYLLAHKLGVSESILAQIAERSIALASMTH